MALILDASDPSGSAIGKLSETTASRHGCIVNWDKCLTKKI